MVDPLTCLAIAIYFEARGEPWVGQLAVGHVIMNRVEDKRYPDDICEAVKQGITYKWSEHPVPNKCQFSFYCDGKSDEPIDLEAYQESRMFAYGAMHRRTKDPTDGATHYHADYVNPSWAASKTYKIQINQHIFYKWENN